MPAGTGTDAVPIACQLASVSTSSLDVSRVSRSEPGRSTVPLASLRRYTHPLGSACHPLERGRTVAYARAPVNDPQVPIRSPGTREAVTADRGRGPRAVARGRERDPGGASSDDGRVHPALVRQDGDGDRCSGSQRTTERNPSSRPEWPSVAWPSKLTAWTPSPYGTVGFFVAVRRCPRSSTRVTTARARRRCTAPEPSERGRAASTRVDPAARPR